MLGAFQLGEFADRRCGTYSGGQRRRADKALGTPVPECTIALDGGRLDG